MENPLNNYQRLVARVDGLCREIENALQGRINCSEGCSDCCAAITLFPVEAAALAAHLETLPAGETDAIRRHVREHAGNERCPLLSRDRCLAYGARPLICRTHGLPILFAENDEKRVDCCPLNLAGCDSLSGSSVIDLDRLNALLVVVNALYLSQTDASGELPERLTIAQAVLGFQNPTE